MVGHGRDGVGMAVRNVPGTYPTIADAVAAATAGDKIAVAAGYAGDESATVTVDNLVFDAPSSVAGIILTAAAGVTTIRLSGNSNISVFGNDAGNVIVGNAGDNVFYGLAGDDQLDGGAGTDTASYALAPAGVTVNLLTGTAADGQGATDTLAAIENVRGSGFADTITGDGGRNVLQGAEDDDKLNGGGGNDELYGDAGNDRIDGGDGDDLLIGGAGNDRLNGGSGRDAAVYQDSTGAVTVNLLTGIATDGMGGTDTLTSVEAVFGSRSGDTLTLGNASGYAFGRDGNDTITGGAGDDEIYGGAGADTIDGGDGSDTASYLDDGRNGFDPSQIVGVKVNLAAGKARDNTGKTDTLVSIENATGSALADILVGDANRNILNGDDGDDTIRGGGGNDALYGGDGADQLQGENGDDTLNGGAGDDTLDGGSGRDIASYENDGGAVTVDLLTGIATDGFGGTDTLIRIESAIGGRFNDTLILANVAGIAYGRAGNDTLTGGNADDELNGGSGADTITGGDGLDTVNYLDDGFDSAGVGTKGVVVNLLTGRAKDNWGKTDTLSGIENATGSSLADTLTGDGGRNVLAGGLGNDLLNGGDGDDGLVGGAGNDTLKGGDGFDYAIYEGATQGVAVNLATHSATDGLGGVDKLAGIEGIVGSRFADSLTLGTVAGAAFGRSGSDVITGGIANDTLYGGSGDDSLDGRGGLDTANYLDDGFDGAGMSLHGVTVDLATGNATDNWGDTDTLTRIENVTGSAMNDSLSGNASGNVLDGQAGNDRLDGKGGGDFLTGGAGADTFAFTTPLGAGNVDTVADFVSGKDHIELAKSVFSALDVGALSSTSFSQAIAATNPNQHILYNATTGVVSYDADGNGATASVAFATFTPGQTLRARDFQVV